ncbi:hypothetical protein MAR_020310 [Mya arenaria]|uniref:Uncharacterized protein n=1 Tax=Mya arenaria TaxID=6604 RepID=A0ABY7E7P0_MYAAR|nr:hypothetical protein MAR_020310 [Mya arenaria]
MATCTEMFENDKTQNCIKCLYGMTLTRNAIVPLANDVMKRFRDDAKETAIKKNKLSESANCSSCSTKDVVPCGTWGLCRYQKDGKWIGSKPEAISTVKELKKLEKNKLSVSSEEVGKLLVLEKGAMEDCKDALNKERDADIVTLKDIVSRLDKVTQLLLVLDRQRPSKRSSKSDDGQLPKRVKRDRASYSSNVEGLLKDLYIFYDKYYSTLPLGPMFEEKVSKLEEVFVLPNLVQQRTETTNEKKRDDMFLSGRKRPWKIAESHVTVSEEDNRIAIQKMSVDSQRKLIVKASNRLVKESYAVDVSKFLEQVERHRIQDFLSNPLAIVQLLCIYHDEKTLVDSRCKIYCQILNMLLGRAKQMFKMNQQNINDGSDTIDLPTCFKQDADQCQEHKSILFRLGEVAYTALKSTSTQVLDESTVSAALRGEQEVSFILTAGLLSKDEQRGKLARQVCRYSFLHSTYQELLCCLYLVCKDNGDDLLSRLLDHLESTGQKDVSTEMFLFFCGMSGKLASRAHDKLSRIKYDQMKKCDRIRFLDVRKSRDLTLKGYEESNKNGVENNIEMRQLRNTTGIHTLACIWHKEFSIKVKDIDLAIKNSSKTLLYVFINGEHGKNIQFASENLNTCWNLHTLELRYIQLTEKLDLSACHTLTSLTIARVKLSEVCIHAPTLHYCFLRTVDESDALFHLSFSNDRRYSVNLKELTLMQVSVVGDLDISECKHLTAICLWNVDMEMLIMESLSVKTCFLGEHIGKNESFWPIVLKALTGSEKLEELYASGSECSSLELFDAFKTIKNVRDLQLLHVNCNDADMQLPKSLQNISLDEKEAFSNTDKHSCPRSKSECEHK